MFRIVSEYHLWAVDINTEDKAKQILKLQSGLIDGVKVDLWIEEY